MESLKWVDTTYVQKHKQDDPKTLRAMYYPNLAMYPTTKRNTKASNSSTEQAKPVPRALKAFAHRYARRIGMLLGIHLASLLPVVGQFVAPAVSFQTFRQSVGTAPAAVIFGTGFLLPKTFLITFLHTYFASRGLMRDLVGHPLSQNMPQFRNETKKKKRKEKSILTISPSSWNPTSAASNSTPTKNANGSLTAKASYSASLSGLLSSSKPHL